ncbi:phospholipase D-like domain-containing protein [Acidianus brierleyi]|nr:phospholipase D family protein [Acidianus brierleyi]
MMSEFSGTQRSGIQSLYTFTPFKQLFGRRKYAIILVPITYLNSTPRNLNWNNGIVDSYTPFFYGRESFKVILPSTINATLFNENNNTSIKYEDMNLKNRNKISKTDVISIFPKLMNFNYDSLIHGYYCKYGFILLNDKHQCPLMNKCEVFEGKNACKYYDGPVSYERLYTVVPHIVRFAEEEGEIGKKGKIISLITVKIDNVERIIGKIEFSDMIKLHAFADASIFYSKYADLMYKDFLWVSYKEGIGFRLRKLNGIIIKFSICTLQDYIKYLLDNNSKLRAWLCVKKKIYFGSKKRLNVNLNNSNAGFNAMKRFEKEFDDLRKGNQQKNDCDNEDLVEFGSFVLLHTLAHIIISKIIIPITPSSSILNDITYFITHPILRNLMGNNKLANLSAVYIIESVYGGLGYIRAIANMIGKRDTNLLNLISDILTLDFPNHEKRFNSSLNNMKNTIYNFNGKIDKSILDILYDVYNEWSSQYQYTHPLHLAVRNYVGKVKRKEINKDSNIRQTFKDVVSSLPLCWDGCNSCVGMDKGCMFGPYDQPFLVSRELVSEFLSTYKDWMGEANFIITKGLYNVFIDLIRLAQKNIKIVSPWIGKDIIDDLTNIKAYRDLDITIVTLDDDKNKDAIQLAENNQIKVIKLKADSQGIVHTKMLIIDDSITMHGSANFTINGLQKNVESEEVSIDENTVKKLLDQFSEIIDKSNST